MGFKIFCTNCGQKLEAEDEHVGHKMPCPVCNESIDITKPRSQGVTDPEVENADSSWAGNTRGKLEDLKNKTQSAVESITNSEKASELKENLKKLGKRGGDAAASTADTLSKSAKIGGLQAKIKKLESIDLRNALLELGEKCFLAGTIKEIEPELYTELERLRKEIDESNDRGLPEMATLGSTEQLRRLGLKAQLKIQEEKLKRQYRDKLIELGKKSFDAEDTKRCFKELTEYIGSLKKQIQEANESIDSLGKGVHHFLRNPWLLVSSVVLVVGISWGFVNHHPSHVSSIKGDHTAAQNGIASKPSYDQPLTTTPIVFGLTIGMDASDARNVLEKILTGKEFANIGGKSFSYFILKPTEDGITILETSKKPTGDHDLVMWAGGLKMDKNKKLLSILFKTDLAVHLFMQDEIPISDNGKISIGQWLRALTFKSYAQRIMKYFGVEALVPMEEGKCLGYRWDDGVLLLIDRDKNFIVGREKHR
jgi:DNA-directed RNA polymerase subunit M/transcription elongation factor TFIIS